jgi:hypothetical protein
MQLLLRRCLPRSTSDGGPGLSINELSNKTLTTRYLYGLQSMISCMSFPASSRSGSWGADCVNGLEYNLDVVEYTTQKLDNNLHSRSKSFCTVPRQTPRQKHEIIVIITLKWQTFLGKPTFDTNMPIPLWLIVYCIETRHLFGKFETLSSRRNNKGFLKVGSLISIANYRMASRTITCG